MSMKEGEQKYLERNFMRTVCKKDNCKMRILHDRHVER